MDPEYIIRVGLRDQSNDGWVWICGPTANQLKLKPRTVIKVRPVGRRCAVYTEVRTIDPNFCDDYNDDPKKRRTAIDCAKDTIVMAEWYRNGLGIPKSGPNDTPKSKLSIKKARLWGLRSLHAACHHPDPAVRLGTRLGMLGVWLGVLALADPALKVYEHFAPHYGCLHSLKAGKPK